MTKRIRNLFSFAQPQMFMQNILSPCCSIKLESALPKGFPGNAGSFRMEPGMGNLLLTTRISSIKPSPGSGFPPPNCHQRTTLSAQRCKSQFLPENRLLFQVFPGICLSGQPLKWQFSPSCHPNPEVMFWEWDVSRMESFGVAPSHPQRDLFPSRAKRHQNVFVSLNSSTGV